MSIETKVVQDAVFAARLHATKGTLLSDEAVRSICAVLLSVLDPAVEPLPDGDEWCIETLRPDGTWRMHTNPHDCPDCVRAGLAVTRAEGWQARVLGFHRARVGARVQVGQQSGVVVEDNHDNRWWVKFDEVAGVKTIRLVRAEDMRAQPQVVPGPGGGGGEISATDGFEDRGPPSARCGQQNEGKNGGHSDGG